MGIGGEGGGGGSGGGGEGSGGDGDGGGGEGGGESGGGDGGGTDGGGFDGGGGIAGGDGSCRDPQSLQSVPKAHQPYSLPGPPSSQRVLLITTKSSCEHELSQTDEPPAIFK